MKKKLLKLMEGKYHDKNIDRFKSQTRNFQAMKQAISDLELAETEENQPT